jgi:hypothetical protein
MSRRRSGSNIDRPSRRRPLSQRGTELGRHPSSWTRVGEPFADADLGVDEVVGAAVVERELEGDDLAGLNGASSRPVTEGQDRALAERSGL